MPPTGWTSRQAAEFYAAVYFAQSGEISAEGPGGINLWRLPGADSNLANQAAPDDRVNFTGIKFDGRLTGNLTSESLKFSTRVRVVNGPVQNTRQQIDPDAGTPLTGGMRVQCDELDLDRWMAQGQSEPNIEINAIGNAIATGRQFHARGHRISYDHLKQIVTMTGLKPSYVHLEHSTPGDDLPKTVVAESLKYFLRTNQFEGTILKGTGSIRK